MVLDKKSILYQIKSANVALEVKDVDMSKRTVDVVLNTYNYLDSDSDVLIPGAAKKSIKERGVNSNATAKIKFAVGHDLTLLPGAFIELGEKKVNYKGQSLDVIAGSVKMATTTLGNDTLINYQSGIYDNHSIGFRYMQLEVLERGSDGWKEVADGLINPQEMQGKDMMFAVKEINLFEGSVVAFGANSLTPFLGTKSVNKEALLLDLNNRMDKLTKALRDGSQSDEMMETLSLQAMQIKQIMFDITSRISTKEQRITTPPKVTKPRINYSNLASQL